MITSLQPGKLVSLRGRDWVVGRQLRQRVHVRQLNLIDEWPSLPRMDVIFLRNVLIYLDPVHRQQVLARAHRLLRSDGYLFLGGAETLVQPDVPFTRVAWKLGSCYRPRP